MVPPDFKECSIRYSWKLSNFDKKVLPVNSEVLIDLKNIESPGNSSKITGLTLCNHVSEILLKNIYFEIF